MKKTLSLWSVYLLALFLALPAQGYHKVGNGDDGGDLEGLDLIVDGPIVEARARAMALLVNLNTPGIRDLGLLLPEVERTVLYRARTDRGSLDADQGAFHSDMQGRVYARTFPQPHAATRFFPVAFKLKPDQLVALHIHEALHRALPERARENEAIVSQLTLAITTPGATHDQVRIAMNAIVPEASSYARPSDGLSARYALLDRPSHFRRISNFSYSYRHFLNVQSSGSFPIYAMHSIRSDLYPFGDETTPFGMGLEASLLSTGAMGTQAGPLGISARLRLWQKSGFDVGIWAVASLNVLSKEELVHSPYGRSTVTAGISMRKRTPVFYIENYLSYTAEGSSTTRIGLVDYKYEYGGITNAKIRAGLNFSGMDLGAFAEIHLADKFRVSGGAFAPFDPGAYRIVSLGPEITATYEGVSVSLFGRFIMDATKGASFDYLGSLMGAGAGQGSIGGAVTYAF